MLCLAVVRIYGQEDRSQRINSVNLVKQVGGDVVLGRGEPQAWVCAT